MNADTFIYFNQNNVLPFDGLPMTAFIAGMRRHRDPLPPEHHTGSDFGAVPLYRHARLRAFGAEARVCSGFSVTRRHRMLSVALYRATRQSTGRCIYSGTGAPAGEKYRNLGGAVRTTEVICLDLLAPLRYRN